MSIFWFLAFPILFVFLFGIIFGGVGKDSPLVVSVIRDKDIPDVDELLFLLKERGNLALVEEDLSSAMAALRRGKRSIVVHYTPSGIVFYAHPQRMERVYMLAGYLQSAFRQKDSFHPEWIPGISVEIRTIEVPQFRQIDYFLPGVLAMAIMQLGLFGSLDFVSLRERKIIQQLQVTPLKKEWLLWSEIVVRLVIAFVQTAVIVTSGWLFFKVQVSGSLSTLFAWILFGACTFVSLGYCLVSFARTVESAQGVIQMVQFPMMFLSGIFFPPEMMPESIRFITRILPLSYFGDALRSTMVGIPTQFGLMGDFLVLFLWLLGTFFLALRFFRWE
ncbi:MAG: ABC transporter permease [Candidatus Caldatribacteriaceae bacterium]